MSRLMFSWSIDNPESMVWNDREEFYSITLKRCLLWILCPVNLLLFLRWMTSIHLMTLCCKREKSQEPVCFLYVREVLNRNKKRSEAMSFLILLPFLRYIHLPSQTSVNMQINDYISQSRKNIIPIKSREKKVNAQLA